MRIVAGTLRGRVLKAPKDADVIRPTADRVRQAVFNVLGQTCEGLTVLDLFAGTGALGFEALSRGATKAVFVDSGREAQGLVRENAEALKVTAQIELLPLPAHQAIAKLAARGLKFELVFADPPYAQEAVHALLDTVHPLLAEGGRLVLEHSRDETAPEARGPFQRLDQRTFGHTVVSIFG